MKPSCSNKNSNYKGEKIPEEGAGSSISLNGSKNSDNASKQQVYTFVIHAIHNGQALHHKYGHHQNTLLHLAVLHDLNDCVEKLLSAGANPSERNAHSQTPSDLAIENGNQLILQMLNRREEYRNYLLMGSATNTDVVSSYEVDSNRDSLLERQSFMSMASTKQSAINDSHLHNSPKSKIYQAVEDNTKIIPLSLGAVYEDYCDWNNSSRCFHLKELIDELKSTEKKLHQELKSLGICKGNAFKNLQALQQKLRNKEHFVCVKLWDTIKDHRENKRVLDLISKDSAKLKHIIGQIDNTVYWFGDVQLKGHKGYLFEKWRNAKLCINGNLIYIHVLGKDESPESVSLDHIISLCSSSQSKSSRESTDGKGRKPETEPYLSFSNGPVRRKFRSRRGRQFRITNAALKKHCVMYSLQYLKKLTIVKNSSQHKLEKELIFEFHGDQIDLSAQHDAKQGRLSYSDDKDGNSHNGQTGKGYSWSIHLRLLDNNKRPNETYARASDCSSCGSIYGQSFITTADNVAHVIKILRNSVEIVCQLDGRNYPYTVHLNDFMHDPDNNRSPLDYLISQSNVRQRRCFSVDDITLLQQSPNVGGNNQLKTQRNDSDCEQSRTFSNSRVCDISSNGYNSTSSYRVSSSKSSVSFGNSMSISSTATSIESLVTIASAINSKKVHLDGIMEEENSECESLEFENGSEEEEQVMFDLPINTADVASILSSPLNINATISEDHNFSQQSPKSLMDVDLHMRHSMSFVETSSSFKKKNDTSQPLDSSVSKKMKCDLWKIDGRSVDDSNLHRKYTRQRVGACRNGVLSHQQDVPSVYKSPFIYEDMIYDINYIPYLRDQLNSARSTSYVINSRLYEYVTKREKLLECLHYLQSLRSVVENPPLAPTRSLINDQSPSMEKVLMLLTVYRDHIDKITQQDDQSMQLSNSTGIINGSTSTSYLSRSPIFKTNYMETLQADFIGRNASFSSLGSTHQTTPLFTQQSNKSFNGQGKLNMVIEATEFVHSMIGEQTYTTRYSDQCHFGRTSSISTLMGSKYFARQPSNIMNVGSFSHSPPFANWDYVDDNSTTTVELQSEVNRVSPWKAARHRRGLSQSQDSTILFSEHPNSIKINSVSNSIRDPCATSLFRSKSSNHPQDMDDSSLDSKPHSSHRAISHSNFRHFLGPPPNRYRSEYEEGMKNIEQIWNCELESFETAERLAQCLVQRERTWRFLCSLREKEYTYSHVKATQPAVELYDIEF